MMTSIFDKYVERTNVLIKNKDILLTTYIPEQLPHRDKNISDLAKIIFPALNKDKPSNILVIGKTGTGKTAVLNYIGKELKKADPEEEKCCFIYVNCEVVDSPYNILYKISNVAIPNHIFPFTGWSIEKLFNEMMMELDKQNKVFIITMDEIDRTNDEIFYYLTTINELMNKSKVSVIGITNNTKFTEFLNPKIRSRLGEEKIVFNPYTSNQLIDIMKERAVLAFNEGVLEEAVIPYCAAISAQDSGDARKALDLLRISAEVAERNGDTMITEAHVKSARDKMEMDAVKEIIYNLTNQSKIVLYSVIKNEFDNNEDITTGDVYTEYKIICSKIGSSFVSQRRVSDLISELDMLGIIHAQVKSSGRGGRTRKISLNISEEIVEILINDELFSSMGNYRSSKQMKLM